MIKKSSVEGFYLSVFVQDVSKETIGVWESLRACTLPHTDHSVLLRMQNTTLKIKIFRLRFKGRKSVGCLEGINSFAILILWSP